MISLIFCGDIKYCPYLARYTERLAEYNIDFEVLFWNRAGFSLNVEKNYYYYDSPSAEDLSKQKKLMHFYGFRKWVINHLQEIKPDGIVFLSTLSGVLLFDVAKKYKAKYIFDIRDYSYENLIAFRTIEKKIIDNSFFTAISSKGFKAFLPEHDYIIAHNFNRKEINDNYTLSKKVEPLQIVWNGTVRFFDYQKKYLDIFKNDNRFQMVYHGAGTDLETYKKYCSKNEINNVLFTGAYDNEDKEQLISTAAFLNNCYGGRDGDQLRYAISNRFYDGIIHHIPQIVEAGGFKASETERLKVGIAVTPSDDLPNAVYQFYRSLDSETFDAACQNAIEEILQEDEIFIKEIDRYINTISK